MHTDTNCTGQLSLLNLNVDVLMIIMTMRDDFRNLKRKKEKKKKELEKNSTSQVTFLEQKLADSSYANESHTV